jgi:ribonuclease HI
MSKEQMTFCVVDGASRNNPGEAGCGVHIKDYPNGMVWKLTKYLGIATSNEAEYHGMILGLEKLVEIKAQDVVIYSDSLNMVKQLNGEYRVRAENLRPLCDICRGLMKKIPKLKIVHKYRENTKLADRLANIAINTQSDCEKCYEAIEDKAA